MNPRILMATYSISAFVVMCSSSIGAEFTYSHLLHARMKLDSDFNCNVCSIPYMQHFRPSVFQNTRNDEFEFQRSRRETVELMKKAVAAVNLDEEIVLRTTVHIGNYDFDKAQFFVNDVSTTTYWSTHSQKSVSGLPYRIDVFLNNALSVRSIPMTEDEAQSFIDRRKDRYGNVDRRLYATFKIKLAGFRENKTEFLAEVQSVEYFSDSHRTKLVHSAQAEASKKPADAHVEQVVESVPLEQPTSRGAAATSIF